MGLFQFVPGFRQWHPAWHRAAGRMLISSGFIAALSGLWMSQFYSLPASDGAILYGLTLFFGSAMIFALVLGVDALTKREFTQHGAWMLRAYAIALGAGKQFFTHLPFSSSLRFMVRGQGCSVWVRAGFSTSLSPSG